MALPDHVGLGLSGHDALMVRDLLAEAAPHCPECKRILKEVQHQLDLLSGVRVPPLVPAVCGNC